MFPSTPPVKEYYKKGWLLVYRTDKEGKRLRSQLGKRNKWVARREYEKRRRPLFWVRYKNHFKLWRSWPPGYDPADFHVCPPWPRLKRVIKRHKTHFITWRFSWCARHSWIYKVFPSLKPGPKTLVISKKKFAGPLYWPWYERRWY